MRKLFACVSELIFQTFNLLGSNSNNVINGYILNLEYFLIISFYLVIVLIMK